MGDLVAQLDIDPARKAKVDAEVWLSELSELSSSNKCNREKIDSQINGLYFEDTGDLISKTSSDSFISNGFNTSPEDPNAFTITPLNPLNVNLPTIMNNKGTNSEIFRVSISSSAPSTSSSTHEEYDTYNEIYIWGENNNFINNRGLNEILTPKVLETDNLFIDIQNISCGSSHAAVLTKNGEIFTWGEEYKGRLGHFGASTESARPRLVNSLTGLNPFEKISCGEFHTCVVNNLGELYTWGDGILGHGLNTNTSIWVPKKVPGTGTMNNLNVYFVSCGTWHTALITTNGQLFTFGDGTFGVLGHNNRENYYYPKLVESLKGLKMINVSCSAWHTAGIVEVVSEKCTGGKLFTWGDGDKFKLGHGDKEPRLIPTCVTSLINHNLISVSCGHSVTICLTTLGKVFTMGSVIYGQLGNPKSDGKNPNLVQGPLINEFVREISCGSYHIALLTDKGDIFTWGKGNNGRLGHGDNEDKKIPTLVEGLKGKTVKSVVCGSNFTVAICLSKRVSGLEQNCCNICRQNFGFTRKKHTCYNCGFVHCNNCSAHKSFRASLAPNISKPYRVCDSCYLQLNNNNNINNNYNNNNNNNNNNNCNNEKKGNHNFPLVQIKDVALNNGRVDLKRVNKKSGNGSFGFRINGSSRPVSPFSRRPSPPRSVTPGRGFSLSKLPFDGLKKSNELLNEEVQRLRDQVGGLKQRCESQEIELKKLAQQASDASQLASEESTKSKAAKEVIKTLTSQLKEMADKIPIIQNNTNGALNNDNNEDIMQNNIETNKKVQSFVNSNNQGDKEWIEQYEPGVYITLMTFHDGTRDLKRVRFSRRRFGENQAEIWWNENREKVYEKYNVRGGSERVSSASSVKSSRV